MHQEMNKRQKLYFCSSIGEKPYHCNEHPECKKTFRILSGLKQHVAIHHSGTQRTLSKKFDLTLMWKFQMKNCSSASFAPNPSSFPNTCWSIREHMNQPIISAADARSFSRPRKLSNATFWLCTSLDWTCKLSQQFGRKSLTRTLNVNKGETTFVSNHTRMTVRENQLFCC